MASACRRASQRSHPSCVAVREPARLRQACACRCVRRGRAVPRNAAPTAPRAARAAVACSSPPAAIPILCASRSRCATTARCARELTVDQLRALGQRLALSSQFGGWQIAIIDPADAMNASAANALLKTLEEPCARLRHRAVADDPSRLPATIRSRCRRIDIPLPTRAEALAWLRARKSVDAATAAATFGREPGQSGRQAEAWVADGALAVREECASPTLRRFRLRKCAREP